MTAVELQAERSYRIQERLGISCGSKEPTPQEEMLAKLTTTEDMKRIEKAEGGEGDRV